MSKSYSSPLCSCIICHNEYSTKSFHTHYQRIHENSQTNYKNKTENATKAAIEKFKSKRIELESIYSINPKICLHCGNIHSYNKRNNKFCSRSCATKHSNIFKDYTKFKPGPSKGSKPSSYIPYTKITQCPICYKYHTRKGKSCSKECKSKILSIKTNLRIDNGWNPQEHRNRSKPSFLESSFEDWLLSNKIKYIKNKTFRCNNKIYYGDFYFPEIKVLIELDGKQHLESKEYDLLRDLNILLYHKVYTFRISYKDFISKSKVSIVETMLL